MTHAVNLLPWRDLRRRRRLRPILLIAAGIMLLGLMILQVCCTVRLQHLALATLHVTADAQLLASLKQREFPMREAWQQHQRRHQQQRRRAATAAWQPGLLALAADLPAQTWPTRLDCQGAVLTANGLALNLQALAGLERILISVAGFAPAKAGGTQRDAGGRWQFGFTLAEKRAGVDQQPAQSGGATDPARDGGVELRCYTLARCRAAAGGSTPRPRPANAVTPGDGITHACRRNTRRAHQQAVVFADSHSACGGEVYCLAISGKRGRDGADPVLADAARVFFLAGALRDEPVIALAGA